MRRHMYVAFYPIRLPPQMNYVIVELVYDPLDSDLELFSLFLDASVF